MKQTDKMSPLMWLLCDAGIPSSESGLLLITEEITANEQLALVRAGAMGVVREEESWS